MRKQPAQAARAPITEPIHLSRWLNKLTQGNDDLDFASSLEYPTAERGADGRPWEESLTLEVEYDTTEDAEDDDQFESLKLTVTTFSDGVVEWHLEVERYLHATEVFQGTNLDEAADKVFAAIWPPTKPDVVEVPAKPVALPHIKLVQQALTNGPQTTWLSYLDITKFNSRNELTTFQVSCAMVGYAVHIADVDHFLRAIDFDLNALNAPKHAIGQRVLTALKNGVKGKANIEGSAKMNDARGLKYMPFMLELNDGVGTVFGMIDLRPQDDEEEDEVDD